MGRVGPVLCEVFPVRGTCACILVGEAGSFLSKRQFCAQWCAAYLLMGRAVGSVLLAVWHKASNSEAGWPLVVPGLSVEMQAFGRFLTN